MKITRLIAVASAAFFFASAALAQTSGTVTNHAFAIGKGAGQAGFTSLLCGSAQLAVGQSAADPICRSITGDVSLSAAGAITLATVNSNVGSFGSATQCVAFTVNAKGLITAASAATCTPAVGSITGLGTGVATALGVNIGSAGAFITFNGALGTPSSGTLTNATGLPISTGVSGLGAGCATFLGTPSSANLRGCLTDEVGTGAAYFVGGALGTPASGTATNLTGLPLSGLVAQAAYSFVVNNTGSSATPTAVDIASFTTKASPAAGDYVILSDQAASGALKKATVSSIASAGSVSSIAGNTGAFTLGAGLTNNVNEIKTDHSFAFRNRIINGDFRIDQRREGASYTLTTSNIYAVDRWIAARGASVAGTAQRNLTGGPSSLNIPSFYRVQRTNGNSGTDTLLIGQPVESRNMTDLAGQSIVVSFYARAGANYSPTSSLLNVQVRSGTAADEGNAGFTGGTWTGAATPINQNATLTTSWQRFSYTATLGSTALELGVLFVMTPTGTAGAADYFDVTGVQIEYGAAPTAYEVVPASEAIKRCQRYFWKTFPPGTAPAQNAGFNGSVASVATIANVITVLGVRFPVQMFKAPTQTYYNPNAANAQWSTGGVNAADAGAPAPTQDVIYPTATTPTISAGAFTAVHISSDAEL